MNICFQNIRVISPAQGIDSMMNLWVKNGKIVYCDSKDVNVDEDTQKIKGDGLVCSPGLFDMHVHFREPGFEYKEDLRTGSEAAANGGFTGVVVMPNTEPAIDNAVSVEYINQKTKDFLTDVYVSAAMTKKREGKHLTPMLELHDEGVVLFTDDGAAVQSSDVMRRIFDYAATKDLLISQHCEDHTLTSGFAMNEGALSDKLGLKGYPYIAEEVIIARDIMLSEYCGRRRYHVQHISTNGAVRLVKDAKSRGLRVTCEVAPHHFSIDDRVLHTFGTNYKMNPPLRRQRDIDAIIEGLIDGTIDCIATDHAPHALHEKDVEFETAPCGIIGLETSLGVTLTYLYHTGHLGLKQIIEKMAVNPRQVLKLPNILIKEGEKANICIFSPDEEWEVDTLKFKSKARNCPYHSNKLKGKPKYTINNGQITECIL